jgi:hypothetical protein
LLLLPIILFRVSEIVFDGIGASFPLRERTQVHLRHAKEKFIRNEEGQRVNENILFPAVSKCCLSPAEKGGGVEKNHRIIHLGTL